MDIENRKIEMRKEIEKLIHDIDILGRVVTYVECNIDNVETEEDVKIFDNKLIEMYDMLEVIDL